MQVWSASENLLAKAEKDTASIKCQLATTKYLYTENQKKNYIDLVPHITLSETNRALLLWDGKSDSTGGRRPFWESKSIKGHVPHRESRRTEVGLGVYSLNTNVKRTKIKRREQTLESVSKTSCSMTVLLLIILLGEGHTPECLPESDI